VAFEMSVAALAMLSRSSVGRLVASGSSVVPKGLAADHAVALAGSFEEVREPAV